MLSDISLAAFGRKEIEIAEVILIDIAERLFFTTCFRMKCQVSCTFATRYVLEGRFTFFPISSLIILKHKAAQPLKGARIAGCLHM